MITRDGYSKDPGLMADGIVVTWSKDLIKEKGGLLSFIRYFLKTMEDPDALWLQKSRNKPTRDIVYVYIIVCNRLKYRLNFVGYETGDTKVWNGDGHSWAKAKRVSWSRIVMAGPIVHAPKKIKLSGFRGFRYCTKLF
jgi:hypothetical protein